MPSRDDGRDPDGPDWACYSCDKVVSTCGLLVQVKDMVALKVAEREAELQQTIDDLTAARRRAAAQLAAAHALLQSQDPQVGISIPYRWWCPGSVPQAVRSLAVDVDVLQVLQAPNGNTT